MACGLSSAICFNIGMDELSRRNIFEIPLMIHSVKFIEGRFGNSISSYFVLSRKIFFLNLLLGLIWTAVILIPGLISQNYNDILNNDMTPLQFLSGDGGFQKSVFFFPNYPQTSPLNLKISP